MNVYQRISLPYELGELNPVIYFKTMYYHYNILHKNYEVKLNETIKGTDLEKKFPSLEELMKNLNELPAEIKEDIRFFGGGLINHNFFFTHLTPMEKSDEKKISLELLKVIKKEFTSLENLKKELTKSALRVRGSGWTWLVLEKKKKIKIINTKEQDGPWSLHLRPLIGIDVWEHAYIIDYSGPEGRKEYVKKLLDFLLDWKYISELYE